MKKGRLLPVYLTYFLDNFGLAIVYPIFTPILLHPQALFSALPDVNRTLLLAILIGIFPAAMFFGAPFVGQFSDRFGRKKAFFITIFGTAFGYTLTAISLMFSSVSLLFLSRLLTGLFASNLTLCLAAIADCSTNQAERTRNFGYIAALGGLGFIIAIALGRYLSTMAPSTPFWLTAGINYLNLFCMATLFHETHQRKPPSKIHPFKHIHTFLALIIDRNLVFIYFANFLFMFAWIASMNAFSTLLKKQFLLSPEQITHSFILCGTLWVACNFAINQRLAARFFPGKTLLVCLFSLSLLLFGLALVKNLPLFLTLFYPATCFAALCWTNSIANISLKAPENIQGSILGLNQSMSSLASMLAPPCALLFAAHGSLYILTALSCLLSFLLIRRFAKSRMA